MLKKILIITDTSYKPIKMLIDQIPKLVKGFVRLGHDVRCFSYNNLLGQLSPLRSRKLSSLLYKKKADSILSDFAQSYQPDIVIMAFPKCFDGTSISRLREVIPKAIYVGTDGDPWPNLHPERIETAKGFDILTATYEGEFLNYYRQAGVRNCVFMPNLCDPDIDRRYEVGDQWRTDILWIGTLEHSADKSDTFRRELVLKLADRENCRLYGCCGRGKIGGQDCLYAISGAKIGVSVNAYGPVRLCHSDRLIRFLAGGTLVLAKRFDGCELLFRDKEHLRYFETIEEFFDLTDWYLKHEKERRIIADAGMKWAHEQFNCTKIAGYFLELTEKGSYGAPWFSKLASANFIAVS